MKQILFLVSFTLLLTAFSQSGDSNLPKGSIIMWGAKTKIPRGWVMCDGLNGTPDLKDKFVEGTTELVKVGTVDVRGADTHTPTGKTGNYIGPDAFDIDPHQHFPGTQAVSSTQGKNKFELNIDPVTTIPPSVRLIYIMKL